MNVCEQCPAYDKCDVTPCGYRGSTCAALRFTCGVDSDPENQNLRVVERGKKVLRGGEVMYKATYKCRMCEETYEDGETNSKDVALEAVINIAKNGYSDKAKFLVLKNLFHDCPDGSIGYADFVGFRKENDNG